MEKATKTADNVRSSISLKDVNFSDEIIFEKVQTQKNHIKNCKSFSMISVILSNKFQVILLYK